MQDIVNLSADKIKEVRGEKYYSGGLMLSMKFSSAMGVDTQKFPDQVRASGINISVLNNLYEDASTEEEADGIFENLRPAFHLSDAEDILYARKESLSVVDAVSVQLAFLTSTGYTCLQEKGDGAMSLADEWRSAWENSVREQCEQERLKTCFRRGWVTPSEYFRKERIVSLRDGIKLYLDNFSQTGAAEVAMFANYPFIEEPTLEKLDLIKRAGKTLSPMFRLAQDVRVNTQEDMNAAIFAYASLNQISIEEAKGQLQTKEPNFHLTAVQTVIRGEWDIVRSKSLKEMQVMAGQNPKESPYIQKMAMGLTEVTDLLAG